MLRNANTPIGAYAWLVTYDKGLNADGIKGWCWFNCDVLGGDWYCCGDMICPSIIWSKLVDFPFIILTYIEAALTISSFLLVKK